MRRLACTLIFTAFALAAAMPAWADGEQFGRVRFNPSAPSAVFTHIYDKPSGMPAFSESTYLDRNDEWIDISLKNSPGSMSNTYLTAISEINAETGKPTISLGELQIQANQVVYNALVANCADVTGGSIGYSYDSQTGDLQLGSGEQTLGRGVAMADVIAWAQEVTGYPGFAFGIKAPTGSLEDQIGPWTYGCVGMEALNDRKWVFGTTSKFTFAGRAFQDVVTSSGGSSSLPASGTWTWDGDKKIVNLGGGFWMALDQEYAIIVGTEGNTNSMHACVRTE